MNSVQKGDEFEYRSYQLIEKALNEYKLGLIPGNCRVFRKKGYYSEKRKGYIIFDLAIEVWPEGASNYSLLNLIECKNYAKQVPVDDIEEFYTKIKQVADVNIKGIFITNNGFQRGAFTFAKSVGMMLITVNDLITLNVILHKANRYKQLKEESSIQSLEFETLDLTIQQVLLRKLQRILDREVLSVFVYQVITDSFNRNEFEIPFLSAKDIEEFTSSLLMAYSPEVFKGDKMLDWEKFEQFLALTYELTILYTDLDAFDSRGHQVNSSCSFSTKAIQIKSSFRNSTRAAFLLAHELGHYFLHNRTSINQYTYESFSDSVYNLSMNRYELNNPKTWIEWQANQFASCLILPRESIIYRLGIEQFKQNLQIGKPLYLDDQPSNRFTFRIIITNLARFYFTTKTSIIYRLTALKMIVVNTRLKSLGQLLRENYPELLDEP